MTLARCVQCGTICEFCKSRNQHKVSEHNNSLQDPIMTGADID